MVSPEALNSLAMKQAEIASKPRESFSEVNVRGSIMAEINFQEKHNGIKLGDSEKVRMYDYMSAMLSQLHGWKEKITKQDVAAMFQSGYRDVAGTGGLLGRDKRQFEVLTNVPEDFKKRFTEAWSGRIPPTNAQIVSAYQQWLVAR